MTDADRPLGGRRVLITRARHQAAELAAAFAEAGAEVEVLPLLEVVAPEDPEPLRRATADVTSYDWLVFTSRNAVDAFLPRVESTWPGGVRVAVIGRATERAALRAGLAPALVARRSVAEGLVEELGPHLASGARILVPQAADARPAVVDGLRALGARVTAVEAYRKVRPSEAAERFRELVADGPLGWIAFTSPRFVRELVGLVGDDWARRRGALRAISIGPTTTAELIAQGVDADRHIAEAASPSPEEMVAAAVAVFAGPAGDEVGGSANEA